MNSIVNLWMKSDKISAKSKDFILKMSDEDMNDAFRPQKLTFGTAGIRQLMGPGTNRMNSYTYQQIADGYAQYLLNTFKNDDVIKVVIGHDNRANADLFSMVCAKVLSSFGIQVFLYKNNELIPTPIVSYTIRKYGFHGGIMVTASHNPKDYLGFKAYNWTGCQISDQDAKIIESFMPESIDILNNDYESNESMIAYLDDEVINLYFEDAKLCLINTNPREFKKFPVIFTAHHGTASFLMPKFLEKLGYTNIITVKQQCVPDSNFTFSSTSNPEDPASFELSEKYAQRANAEIMLGVDPDADRLAVAVIHNGSWRYLTGNEMGIIFSYYILNNKKFSKTPFIVSSFVSTYLIDHIATHYGAKVYRTPTGFKNLGNVVEQKSNNEDFVVAFEEAIGSLNSTINRDKDSFQAAALALEIYGEYRKHNMSLLDLLNSEIYPLFGCWAGGTMSYTFECYDWREKMNQKMNYFSQLKDIALYDVRILSTRWSDETKILEWILQDNMWIKVRMSGTEPKFKIYFNIFGNTINDANNRYIQLKEIIKEMMRE